MAIIDSIWLQGARKRLDNVVLYKAMGQTRSRKLRTSITNPRTQAQMTQRIKWSNLVNFYRTNATWMKYAFETKKANQSEYNKFMSINVTASQVALTKDMAAGGAAVVYPYIMTQGSLPSIEWQNADNVIKSNIFIPANNTLEDYVSVGDLSTALISTNPALREGDQLSFIRLTQMTNAAAGYPYVVVRKYEMVLDKQSSIPVAAYWPLEFFSVPGTEQGNVLQVKKENRQGGFLMILSRTISGKTYVSTQSVVIVNNEALIAQYTSNSAIAAAIASYGESEDAFLSSTSANSITSSPLNITINYMTFNEVNYAPGSQTLQWDEMGGGQASVYFNDNLPSGVAVDGTASFGTGGSATISNPNISGNRITFTFPAVKSGSDEKHLIALTFQIAGTDYTIKFASENSYTIQGLE